MEQMLPEVFSKSRALPTPSFQTSRLQLCKEMNVCCLRNTWRIHTGHGEGGAHVSVSLRLSLPTENQTVI